MDNGSTWHNMLNEISGYWINDSSAIAVNADGALYMASGFPGTTSLVYTSDGVYWSAVGVLPDATDWVDSIFILNNIVYVGTGNGNVAYTSDNGVTWTVVNSPDASAVNAIFINNDTWYVGTANGNVLFSVDNGISWSSTANQPDGNSITSLSVDAQGVIDVITTATNAPLYLTKNSTNWAAMETLPTGNNRATAIFSLGTTVYVGTDTGNILYTTDQGASWTTTSTQPDGSSIMYLFSNQNALSPVFVETSGAIAVNGNQTSVTITNLSNITLSNVRAQLPSSLSAVTQDASNCTFVAPWATCTLAFTSTQPYAPQNISITSTNFSKPIFRLGMAFSINGYLVYNIDDTYAYIVDNNDAVGSPNIWSSNDTHTGSDFVSVWGIAENSTTLTPYPNASAGATQYSGQNNCNGATDGACDANNILVYYNDIATNHPINLSYYATGLCYQSTVSGVLEGSWYLPSTCELNGGLYVDAATNTLTSCSPSTTGILSLHSLGLLPNIILGNYWSSTEHSSRSNHLAWYQNFSASGGGSQDHYPKAGQFNVRCVQAVPL